MPDCTTNSDAQFSTGDFVSYPDGQLRQQDHRADAVGKKSCIHATQVEREEEEIGEEYNALFSCPVDGCMSTFQRHCNLERHLLYGKCKLVEERFTLLDKAKVLYCEKLQEGTSTQPSLAGPTESAAQSNGLTEGWARKVSKKATRLNENQKKYLDDKFRIGQETGHKADPVQVARDLRYTRSENGLRRFTVEEFLTPQQIQSYFSRTAAKLRHGKLADIDERDMQAAEEEAAHSSARADIMQEFQLIHPIVYDAFNVCALHNSNKLSKLSTAQLRLICSHYNMDVDRHPLRRKAPYIAFISDLVGSCSCQLSV